MTPHATTDAQLVVALPTIRVHTLLGEYRRMLLDVIQQYAMWITHASNSTYSTSYGLKFSSTDTARFIFRKELVTRIDSIVLFLTTHFLHI